MTDIENQVFTKVKQAVTAVYSGAFVSGTTVDAPPQFPCVYVVERSNTSLRSTQDSSSTDNHSVLMYQVDIYSAKVNGKKAEAKAIGQIVDGVLVNLGFTRAMFEPTDNADTSIYRITARYNAIVDKNERIYRR